MEKLLLSLLRASCKTGMAIKDTVEGAYYKANDYGIRHGEKKYGKIMSDEQKYKIEGEKQKLFSHYVEKAQKMTSKELVKALNRSSGIEYEAYCNVAERRGGIKYKYKKGKWKLKKNDLTKKKDLTENVNSSNSVFDLKNIFK